jgi:hypothetical protein
MMIKTIRSLRSNLAAIHTAIRASSEYSRAVTGAKQASDAATCHIPL